MISVICVSNNLGVANSMLIKSLKNQTIAYEMILMDNTHNQYSSAAKALNAGAIKANGDILVFAHQDIEIGDPDFFKHVIEYNKQNEHAIFGLAGATQEGLIYTNITQGPERIKAGAAEIQEPTVVQTLDEVMLIVPRSLFDKLNFDEETCDDWHLYAVDYSLSAAAHGYQSFVIPSNVYHLSVGTLSYGFAKTLRKVVNKHKDHYVRIETTCASTKTSFLSSSRYLFGLIWDHEIKKKFGIKREQ